MGRKKDAIGRLIKAMSGELPELEASIDDYIEKLVQTADVLETRLTALEQGAGGGIDDDDLATDEEVEEELKPKPKPDPDAGSQEEGFED